MLAFTDQAARQLQAIYTTPDIAAKRRAALDLLHLLMLQSYARLLAPLPKLQAPGPLTK